MTVTLPYRPAANAKEVQMRRFWAGLTIAAIAAAGGALAQESRSIAIEVANRAVSGDAVES